MPSQRIFRMLDIGSGTGLLAAMAALLVGKGGEVNSLDIRSTAIKLSKGMVKELRARNKE